MDKHSGVVVAGMEVSKADQRMEELYMDWKAKVITTDEFRYYSSSNVKLRNYFVVKAAKPAYVHDSVAVQAVVAQQNEANMQASVYLSNAAANNSTNWAREALSNDWAQMQQS